MAMLLDGYTGRQKDMGKGAKTVTTLQGGIVIWVCESTASAVGRKRTIRVAVEREGSMARGGGTESAHKGPISVCRRAVKWLMGAALSMELSVWGNYWRPILVALSSRQGSSWRRLMKLLSSPTTTCRHYLLRSLAHACITRPSFPGSLPRTGSGPH